MDYWKGKIAVVTGASSGIGAQTVVDLAKAGITVIGLARRVDRIKELATENKNTSGKIHAYECDVGNIESIVKAFKWIEDTFKVVHIIINNAGRSTVGQILDNKVSHQDMKNVIDVNLSGVVVCTREAYRLMEKHEDLGYIININSILGHISYSNRFAGSNVYCASKHGVTSHTETVRLDLAHQGNTRIRVTSVSPGLVQTEILIAAGIPKEYSDERYNSNPCIQAADVSNAIIFLLGLPKTVNITELTIKPTGETC